MFENMAPMLTVDQLEESCGICNPAEQLAYYWLRAVSEEEQVFAKKEILKAKQSYKAYCRKHEINEFEAWAEIEHDAQLLVNSFTQAYSAIAG